LDVRADCTLDRFLDGRIIAAQPRHGFRAGHDTVLLAAAVPAGARVLELGSGAGIASLCYGWRIGDADVTGVEIDPGLVEIANANAVHNGMGERIHFIAGDVRDAIGPPETFDHVFFNPPFHSAEGTESPDAVRNIAKRDPGSLIVNWTQAALRCVQPDGSVTAILRFDRVQEMLVAAEDNAAAVFPLYPRRGAKPKRAVVQVTSGKHIPLHTGSGLILHGADGGNTEEAEAILRAGEALPWT
jgi:tRNA1Val (adenine37-N6)-methyltransferase